LAAAVAEISLSMTLKTGNLHKGSGRARLWAMRYAKVNQGYLRKCQHFQSFSKLPCKLR
jgi:hypothetical protein